CLSLSPVRNSRPHWPVRHHEELNNSQRKTWASRSNVLRTEGRMPRKNRGNVLKSSSINSDTLEISVNQSEEGALVRLQGRLGIDSSPDLRDRLLAMFEGQPSKVVIVDLTEVSYIDVSGVATLLEALKIARNRHTMLRLKGLHGRLARLFEVTGLTALFETSGFKSAASTLRVP